MPGRVGGHIMKRLLITFLLACGFAQFGLAMDSNGELAQIETIDKSKLRDELDEFLFRSIPEYDSIVCFRVVRFAPSIHGPTYQPQVEQIISTQQGILDTLLSKYSHIEEVKNEGWSVVGTPQYQYNYKQATLGPKLCWAFQGGKYAQAETLLDEGADINTRVIQENTPLMIAVCRSEVEVCKQLLRRNPDITAVNEEGRSALMIAANCGSEPICELIVQALLKPTQQQKDAIIAFLACKKKGCLLNTWGVPRDIVHLIGRCMMSEANKAKTLEEINKIKNEGIKKRLIERFIKQ
jgi:hypothetical protein